MIDKQEFYWGAAVVRLLEHPRFSAIRKHEYGYLVNSSVFVFLKYSTKARSPWGFSFTNDELPRLVSLASQYERIVLGLICGGDGICAVDWKRLSPLLGDKPGWISVRRNFNERYGVSGPAGGLDRKVPLQGWPLVVFE